MQRTMMAGLVVVVAMATLAIGVSAPALAAPGATCTYTKSTGVVTIQATGETSFSVWLDGSTLMVAGQPCAETIGLLVFTAKTYTTDKINVTGDAADQNFSISLADGRYGPGVTDEPGNSDEIEFAVNLGGGDDYFMLAYAGNARQVIRFGTPGTVTKVNLNAGEAVGVDADITVRGAEDLGVLSGDGPDTISAAGGKGTGNPLQQGLFVDSGLGEDDVTGGAGPDELWAPFNYMAGDRGYASVVRGGAGADLLWSWDMDDLDTLNGGTGVDECGSYHGGDVKISC